MFRHKGFETEEALNRSLSVVAPSDAYYSSAFYEHPEAEMSKKDWLGADLVFDIDADHIPTPCGKIHDSWACRNCNFEGKGPPPERCPKCGKEKFNSKAWMCDSCLEFAKAETIKLVDMLMQDFGFSESEIKAYFSGNRGYHVHVESKTVLSLDSMARKEIVDHIIGLGFETEFHKLTEGNRVVARPEMPSWRGRIAKGLHLILSMVTLEELEAAGLKRGKARYFDDNRKELLSHLSDKGWLGIKEIGSETWKRIIQLIVHQQSAKIDTVVTTDVNRLIRLPGSLHGKTGFMKVEAPLSGFEGFDPLKKGVVFKTGQVVVDIVEAPEFRIGETQFGPFKRALGAELPIAAALFLVCKGAAQVVNGHV